MARGLYLSQDDLLPADVLDTLLDLCVSSLRRGHANLLSIVPHSGERWQKKLFTLLDLCVSSLRRGHANLLCIVPILTDDPRRESNPGL